MPHVCRPKAFQDLVMIIPIALMTMIRMIGAAIETDEYLHDRFTLMIMMMILMMTTTSSMIMMKTVMILMMTMTSSMTIMKIVIITKMRRRV